MTKIKAFITALILLLILLPFVHLHCTRIDLTVENGGYNTWYSSYKDLSYVGIMSNLKDNTMLVMGSSEFGHNKGSKYHLDNLLENKDTEIMCIGGAYNQSLFHTIMLGSVEKNLKNRKVVLMLSPTWFRNSGVTKGNYALRFSVTEYAEFMSNENIPKDIKEYVAERTEDRLSNEASKLNKAKRINRIYLEENANLLDRMLFKLQMTLAMDQEALNTKVMMKGGKGVNKKVNYREKESEAIDFQALYMEADKTSASKSTNKYGIPDKDYYGKFKKAEKYRKNRYKDEYLKSKNEFKDLECFLKTTKALGIETEVIIMPLNGAWYDHSGLGNEKREKHAARVKELCDKYGAESVNMNKYCYEKYFFEDAVHPWDKGWVKLNEEIYKFYNKN